LAGAAVFVGLSELHINRAIPAVVGGVVVVAIRELSIHFKWNLPKIA
jgi:uncharacterized membrane protein YeiH